MQLIYFDESKYSEDNPYFSIGGILVDASKARGIEALLTQIQFNFFGTSVLSKEYELHGKDCFHGKGNFKNSKIADRVKLFDDISSVIINNNLAIRIVCIDVIKHRNKYYYAMPEYRLGLMLFLERSCDYLDSKNDTGLVFGDYEKDEITKSILDFSQFKISGKTPMYYGRALGRLVDTVYFTHSHHSRFLQAADMIMYLANRYGNGTCNCIHWHDLQLRGIWEKIKTNADIAIQHWP
jgi:hypothetical protein